MLLAAFLLIWAAGDAEAQPASPALTRADILSDFQRFLTFADADGDGALDQAEWTAILYPASPASPDPGEAGPRAYRIGEFDRMDSDRDGKVILDELVREPLANFDCLDSDRDLRLSETEMETGIGRCPTARGVRIGFISEPPADLMPDR